MYIVCIGKRKQVLFSQATVVTCVVLESMMIQTVLSTIYRLYMCGHMYVMYVYIYNIYALHTYIYIHVVCTAV